MNIIVLDSATSINPEIGSQIASELTAKGFNVDHIDLSKLKITHCTGCFECWVKTPGICKFEDDAPEISKKFVNSDIAVFISDIVFGGFSSTFKRMWDRNIPVLLPYFTKINGEYHHMKRYDKYPRLIVLGIDIANEDKWNDLFLRFIDRNVLNWHPPDYRTRIISEGQRADVCQLIDEMGVFA